jgi:hypothetical protein
MATPISDRIETRVGITDAELITLLGQKAIDAGYIDYTPIRIELDRIDDVSGNWLITFHGERV